jgi:hypothetical protein
MENAIIDQTQHKAAKLAGFTLIFAIAIVVISNYSVTFKYVVPDAGLTARNILAHETLFRFNIFCNLIYLLTLIIMSTSFYVMLRPVNRNFALSATLSKFVYAFLWAVMAINTFNALRVLGDMSFLQVFEDNQLQALAKLNLSSSWDTYYVGLPFWGLSTLICSVLLFKSKYIPRLIATFGIVSSAWCVFCAFTYLIWPQYGNIVHIGLFDVPMVGFEVLLGLWLLFKGLKSQE